MNHWVIQILPPYPCSLSLPPFWIEKRVNETRAEAARTRQA